MNQIKKIKEWFEEAVPTPTDTNKRVQTGVHLEEVAEMCKAMVLPIASEIDFHANHYKTGTSLIDETNIDRKELLDALCDQIVTAVGIAHMYNLDIVEGLHRVNKSNWSKFVDGKAVFDENGKIKKGPDYHKPDLTGLY